MYKWRRVKPFCITSVENSPFGLQNLIFIPSAAVFPSSSPYLNTFWYLNFCFGFTIALKLNLKILQPLCFNLSISKKKSSVGSTLGDFCLISKSTQVFFINLQGIKALSSKSNRFKAFPTMVTFSQFIFRGLPRTHIASTMRSAIF